MRTNFLRRTCLTLKTLMTNWRNSFWNHFLIIVRLLQGQFFCPSELSEPRLSTETNVNVCRCRRAGRYGKQKGKTISPAKVKII